MTTPDEPTAKPALPEPIPVFSHGPWLFQETGQSFTGAELDAACFAKYRAAIEAAADRTPDDTARLLRASVEMERLRKSNAELLAALRSLREAVRITRACLMDSVETHGTHGGWLHEEATRLMVEEHDCDAALAKAQGGAA